MNQTIGRFAPTPSGRMHLGNLFCGLLAWLAAKKENGSMVLRIEDLDPQRSRKEFSDIMQQELLWFGLTWEQGGDLGGPHPPYYQSQCGDIYRQALKQLREKGLVYPCFCSRAELHAANAPHFSDGRYLYAGTCRNLTPQQQQEKAKQKHPALRVRVPDAEISFCDLLYGQQSENLSQEAGDFLICRADGVFAYQLAVVVDDLRMGVTQVVRGCDLLGSTARQIWLAQQLGAQQVPEYGHVPLLLGSDGSRLSKRDGALSLDSLRSRYTPQQILGKLAWLAGLIDRPQVASLPELVEEFDWKKLPKQDICIPDGLF